MIYDNNVRKLHRQYLRKLRWWSKREDSITKQRAIKHISMCIRFCREHLATA